MRNYGVTADGEVTVRVRIEELRAAADTLGNSAFHIRTAVESAHQIVDALYARGFQSEAAELFATTYRHNRTIMDEWPDELDSFSGQLNTAADTLESAINGGSDLGGLGDGDGITPPGSTGGGTAGGTADPGYPSDTGSGTSGNGQQSGESSGTTGGMGGIPFIPTGGNTGTGTSTSSSTSGTSNRSGSSSSGGNRSGGSSSSSSSSSRSGNQQQSSTGGSGESSESAEAVEEAPPEAPPIDGYLNQHNRGLMDSLTSTQNNLQQQQSNLTTLQDRRTAVQQELDALLARMGGAGATPNARIRGLQQQLLDLEAQIGSTQESITGLEGDLSTIQARLDAVRPGPGADLELIASLEGGHTNEAILASTRQADNSVNCVNYVCSRMNIPPGIPNNALLWPANAMNHPEYGITIGDHALPGSVVVMQPAHGYGDDRFGHVMYVERIDPDGSIWITDNNYHSPVRLQDLTDEISGPNISYMYFPWETAA